MIRKHFAGFAASALALAVSAQVFAGTVTTDGADIVVKTKGGLEVATTDKEFSFKLGGRLQADYGRFDGFFTGNGETADAAFFRRAFIEVGGTVYKDWKYQINYDLSHNAGGGAGGGSSNGYFDEASVTYTGFSPINVKVGRFDPDFGLEKATSSKSITAIERTAAYEVADWVNGHDGGLGVQVNSVIADMGYVSGGVTAKDADDEDGDSIKAFNGRFVFAPLHEAGNVLHVGVNYAYRDLSDATFDSRIRPRLTVRGVATDGGKDAGANGNRANFSYGTSTGMPVGSYDDDAVWGLEAAWAMGPFSVQGEYLRRNMDAGTNNARYDDVEASGYYGQVAYTLTGESRGYKLDGGKFDAIKPGNKQLGAWEVFYRYDHVSVDDSSVATSTTKQDNESSAKLHTVGLNWYANESVKVSANYIKAKTDNIVNANGDDDGDAFVARVQYAF